MSSHAQRTNGGPNLRCNFAIPMAEHGVCAALHMRAKQRHPRNEYVGYARGQRPRNTAGFESGTRLRIGRISHGLSCGTLQFLLTVPFCLGKGCSIDANMTYGNAAANE